MKNSLKKENIRIFDIIFEESSTLAFSYQSSLEVRIQPWLPYLRVVLFRCYHMSRRSLRFFCMATQGFLCFGLTYYVIIKKPHSLRSCQFFDADALFRSYTEYRRSLRFFVQLHKVFVFQSRLLRDNQKTALASLVLVF